MKFHRILALLLSFILFFSGCETHNSQTVNLDNENTEIITVQNNVEVSATNETDEISPVQAQNTVFDTNSREYIESLNFTGLNSEDLQRYVRDTIYSDLVSRLDSDKYLVENVETLYYTKEYLEELEYNSRENIYFGYTLSELEKQFQGTKYIFTLDENGQTIVKPFEEYDDTFDKAVKNVAIGTGVILVCVTVSVVSAGAGAPAISLIFATSAKSAAICATSSGVISGVSAAVVEGVETQDFDKALKAAALKGSEGFMWAAVSGSVTGGVGKTIALKGAALNGLTMNQAAAIQMESKYPLDVIKQFRNMKEYEVYKEAHLKTQMVRGKIALIQDIDPNFTWEGKSNLERMKQGNAPIDPISKLKYELHHIGQKLESTLAILTDEQHKRDGLHNWKKNSEIDRPEFAKYRREFWKEMAKIIEQSA